MKTLTAENISYTYQTKYQKVYALKNVSCTFRSGKFYAVTGHSGCGKTTLLSMLAGLGTPDEGVVKVDGQPLDARSVERHRRENVSVIYQAFNLFPTLTVLENVMFPQQIAGRPARPSKERAADLLRRVGIGADQHKKFPSMLSGGEQQRVAIARALCGDARIILADEPTGNLDSENGDRVIDLLMGLAHEQAYCVVAVTHDLGIAARADVVYRMRDGRLEAHGDEN
ncbi:MAG: ABC transporter ATP-binding protein [Eubacteriales bacterium]|nr:ABC transporter ATP-binding protein [Eubacteriales bacterium]